MTSSLEGKTFLVTGANTGIGRVTALELARCGARLWLACRSEEKTRPVLDEIRAATGKEANARLKTAIARRLEVRNDMVNYSYGSFGKVKVAR